MGEKVYQGKIKAKIIEVRFAVSGRLSGVFKKKGDLVKKGEMIASLDKKIWQMELDRQLADYEKKRADFEIFNLQKGEPQDDIAKYLKTEKQAELNASVKEVELAKAGLDQADLFSPIEGMVIGDSNCVAGIYITPSSNPFRILDPSSYYFEIEIKQTDLPLFLIPKPVMVKIPGIGKEISGNAKVVTGDEKGEFTAEVTLQDTNGLLFGLKGECQVIE